MDLYTTASVQPAILNIMRQILRTQMKLQWEKVLGVFVVAFALNLLWENWHAQFYTHYKGGDISPWLLFGHALYFDAVFIVLMYVLYVKIGWVRRNPWLVAALGVIVAVLVEWYALYTGRWGYAATMVIVPVVHTGLTPTVQLALLGYGIIKIAKD